MYWLLSLSVGAVRARFAENSCKVFPELCRFPARRRLRGEPGAEGESVSMSVSMRLGVSLVWVWDWEYESNIFLVYFQGWGEREVILRTTQWGRHHCEGTVMMSRLWQQWFQQWPWWWPLWKSNAKLMNTWAMWCVLPKISRAVTQGCEPSPGKSKQ